ncbi:MAG: alpha-E domain-containing protein [Deinococcota bacterium]
MLSRIAENLYWIGRYVERAENTARLLDVNYLAVVESSSNDLIAEQWEPLLTIIDDDDAAFCQHYAEKDRDNVSDWLAFNRDNASSITSSLTFARENARTLRDRISLEMWEAMNRAYLEYCVDSQDVLAKESLHNYCAGVRDASHLFFGIADATMPRDLGWFFMRAGQYLERSDNVLRILTLRYRQQKNALIAQEVRTHRSVALLRTVSALEAFRKQYHTGIHPDEVAEFLLLNADFPRSVRFSLRVVHEILKEIQTRNDAAVAKTPVRQAGWLAARLEYLPDAKQVFENEDPPAEDLLDDIASLSNTISQAYFVFNSDSEQAQLQQQT